MFQAEHNEKTLLEESFNINGQLPTFALACARLSSARPRFTSEFGKGSGSSAAYMPPNRQPHCSGLPENADND